MSYHIHPGVRDSDPFKEDTSILKDICSKTDHIIALVPAPISYRGLPIRTAVLSHHFLDKQPPAKHTEPVAQEPSPPSLLNHDNTLVSVIQEQIRKNQVTWEAKREQERTEDAERFSSIERQRELVQLKFSTLEATRVRERNADDKKLKKVIEDAQVKFSASTSRVAALEKQLKEQREASDTKIDALKAQLRDNVDELHRVSHQYY